ncbi:hypothetical protein GWN42_25955, partial [candidate division KSB1 bacterium]|nr:hypothetical protein [candidate division KSB1 bacterium]
MQQIPTPAHPIPEAPQVSITPDQLYLPQTGQESEERAYDMLHDVYRRLEEDPQNEQLRTAYEQASKQYQEAIPGFARAGEPLAEYVTRPLARAAKSVAAGTLGTLGDIGGMAGDVAVDIGETVANIPSKALEMLGAEGVAEATRIELPRFKSDTSEWIRQSFDIGTGGLTKPRSATERIADLAGETVAGSFAFQPIASGMKAAGASPAVASAIEGMTPQSVKGMVSATNAGIGAGAAREAFPDNPYAELVGGLLGGFSVDMPAELMKSKVVKKIGDVVRKVAKGGTVEDVLERTGLIGTRAERYA